MNALRTPEARFADLPGYPFEPHYVDVDGLRVHYVDEGTRGAAPVVLLHGEPSWSYLYRTVIAVLAGRHRVVAPDLVGFGRSDKPDRRRDYTYARHVEWLRAVLFDHLRLADITLVGQDWGGLLGLRLVAEHPERFARVVAANTALPTGDVPLGEAFFAWQRFSQEVPELPIGAIIDSGTLSSQAPEVIAAYDAPFPDERYKEGARQFPLLVPSSHDDPASEDNRRAWASLRRFTKPFLCAFSDTDPITRGADRQFLDEIPGTARQPHTTITGAGHFLQEDKGGELAAVVAGFIDQTS